ncbi:glycosyltransferase [[Phormidium] sp. ETS-05]|uniref:glycosyltransferase n=1 Tax=[Phormidium] sp. ETS-05 TaxID=222819 RepID=UPI0018EF31D7|nr:cellulose synthase catalytic subunit [[Phormidium] sp. ETS-05]
MLQKSGNRVPIAPRLAISSLKQDSLQGKRGLQTGTLVTLGLATGVMTIAIGWVAGVAPLSSFFTQWHLWQQQPPIWVEVPDVSHDYYLLIPTLVLVGMAVVVQKISPRPQTWSRVVVISIVLALTVRYWLWRSLSTLYLADPINGLFSLGLFILEILAVSSTVIQLYLNLSSKDRRREADLYQQNVIGGNFTPAVDIFIPTYNEPIFILRRTVIGCQAIKYHRKKIYLLDDTRRPEVKQLAAELGCEYITRAENRHAKAGNLNHALSQTDGELIAIFDADFVPTENFLSRTVGFFQNQKIALVQTPQTFYNPDPIARNLGLEEKLTAEEEIFYRHVQPIKDGAGAVVCAGTSFVVRRRVLEAVGGFVTDSISEDYFTGIKISALGYDVVYLDEKLSAGLAAENMAAFFTQRLRWARGTLQAFFIEANPLTIPGLSWRQRLAHLEGIFSWFNILARVVFLMMPIASAFLGVVPLKTNGAELLYFFLPYYLISLTTFGWLNQRSRSVFLSDLYAIVLCFPLALTVVQAMLYPFAKGFQVTPKGNIRNGLTFNWNLALPLILFSIATALACLRILGIFGQVPITPAMATVTGINLAVVWGGYNFLTVIIALFILIDAPKPDPGDWLGLRRVVEITPTTDHLPVIWGETVAISDFANTVGGAEVMLAQPISFTPGEPVTLEILSEGIKLRGKMFVSPNKAEMKTGLRVRIAFEPMTVPEYRQLVTMLFCRPGRWQRQNVPGEWGAILLMLRLLLQPPALFKRNQLGAIPVSQI